VNCGFVLKEKGEGGIGKIDRARLCGKKIPKASGTWAGGSGSRRETKRRKQERGESQEKSEREKKGREISKVAEYVLRRAVHEKRSGWRNTNAEINPSTSNRNRSTKRRGKKSPKEGVGREIPSPGRESAVGRNSPEKVEGTVPTPKPRGARSSQSRRCFLPH